MLLSLHIENYALISSLQIDFDKGMNVITGETGAGKSIMMGALGLIQGNRADTGVLFDKTKKCYVEAVFSVKDLELFSFFEENNLDYQENTIIRREISESGKSRAFINDTPVNLTLLKELSGRLIDIHSQHHNLLFQNADFRADVVDAFADLRSDVGEYRSVLNHWKETESELAELVELQKSRLEKKDFLEFVYNELVNAKLVVGEQEQLEQDVDFLSHTETIKENLYQIANLLSEKEQSILDSLRDIKNLFSSISSYQTDIKELANRIDSSFIDLKDIASEVSSLNEKVDYDPETLESKRERLDVLNSLEQKHRVASVEELISKMTAIGEELAAFTDDDQNIQRLRNQSAVLQKDAMDKAKHISKRRAEVIPLLQKQVVEKVKKIGIPDAQFVIELVPSESLQKNGIDSVRYLFSANRGVDLAELEKVASGGEMSRLMLAVKSTLSDRSVLPTVVFDEIDVGISGEVAGKVAAMMKEMASARQLLVITHLPQIAAKGNAHYHVFKQVIENKSRTLISLLEKSERVREIAKMMSGDACGDATLQAAKELIEQ